MSFFLLSGWSFAEPLSWRLEDALKRASERSLEVLVSNQHLKQSVARLNEARASYGPQLSLTASQSRQTRNLDAQGIRIPGMDPVVGPFNSFDARARLSQTLWDAASINRWKRAEQGLQLSQAEERKTRQDVLALVGNLFIEAARAQKALDTASIIAQKDRRASDLGNEQERVGSASKVDRERRNAAADRSDQRLSHARVEADGTRRDLLTALGFSGDEKVVFVESSLKPPADWTVSVALDRHPDIVLARERMRYQEQDQWLTRSDRYPKLSLSADYGWSGGTPANAERTYAYGAQASWAFFQSGGLTARAEQSAAAQEEAMLREKDIRLRTETALSQNVQVLEDAWLNLKAERTHRDVFIRERRVAETRLRVGSASAQDVRAAQADEAAAEDRYQEALATYQLATISYLKAAGTLDRLTKGQALQ